MANTDAVVRFLYSPGVAEILGQPQQVTALNHRWTKSLVAVAQVLSYKSARHIPLNLSEPGFYLARRLPRLEARFLLLLNSQLGIQRW